MLLFIGLPDQWVREQPPGGRGKTLGPEATHLKPGTILNTHIHSLLTDWIMWKRYLVTSDWVIEVNILPVPCDLWLLLNSLHIFFYNYTHSSALKVPLLEAALFVHGRRLTEAEMALHNHMVTSFNKMQAQIQDKYGIGVSGGPTRWHLSGGTINFGGLWRFFMQLLHSPVMKHSISVSLDVF